MSLKKLIKQQLTEVTFDTVKPFGTPRTASAVTSRGVSDAVIFGKGELTDKEWEHAKLTAQASFTDLIFYGQEMQKSHCSYSDAVRTVLGRRKARKETGVNPDEFENKTI